MNYQNLLFCLNVLYRDAPSSGHNGQIYGTERNAVVCYYYLNVMMNVLLVMLLICIVRTILHKYVRCVCEVLISLNTHIKI